MRPHAMFLVLFLAVSAQASTTTIATFDDPAADASTPLFEYDAGTNTLSGEWLMPWLMLETLSGDYPDATFTMSALPGDEPGEVGAGEISFLDVAGDEIFLIEFDSAQLTITGFGATEFLATNEVTFSGSILTDPVDMESFSFAFANQTAVGTDGSFTATAAFTSSAFIIPEPATLALLSAGALALVRRRR